MAMLGPELLGLICVQGISDREINMSILSPTPPASENAEIRFTSLLVLIAAIALPTIATTEIKQPLAIADTESVSQHLASVLSKDLDADTSELIERLRAEREIRAIQTQARSLLQDSYAGSWFDSSTNQLVVATSNGKHKQLLSELGAETQLATYSLSELEAAQARLNETARAISTDNNILGWGVEIRKNKIIMRINESNTKDSVSSAKQLIVKSRINPDLVDVIPSGNGPGRIASSAYAGEQYDVHAAMGHSCSVGLAVDGGFITAGHCLSQAQESARSEVHIDGVKLGDVQSYEFGENGDDLAYITTQGQWRINSLTRDLNQVFTGKSESPIGASVCSYGESTKLTCGEIEAKNQTQLFCLAGHSQCEYIEGLTRSSVHVELGDSGGPFFSGSQAQGITIGTQGGSSFFEPIEPALSKYDVDFLPGAHISAMDACWGNYSISWNSVPGHDNYQLHRDFSASFGNPQTIWSGSQTSTSVSLGTDPNHWEYFRVVACDGSNCNSYSNQVALNGDPNICP